MKHEICYLSPHQHVCPRCLSIVHDTYLHCPTCKEPNVSLPAPRRAGENWLRNTNLSENPPAPGPV